MLRALLVLCLVTGWCADSFLVADDVVRQWLNRPLIGAAQSQLEVQAFVSARVAKVPTFHDRRQWETYAAGLRDTILDKVVFRGEASNWRQAETRVEWLQTVAGGPGYKIRKLRYEALPGLWIPALLYEPDELAGRVPVVMNVNGHDGEGKAAEYKQLRCINQVKRGMLALNVEWLGMGQLRSDGFTHYKMNQLDLCGTSGLAPFYLAMTRGLDLLLTHPHADPDRVAVAGLSGGGWQTIFVSSLDTRVTLANPVAGYSSFITRAHHTKDLGDSEQTPSDLGKHADYTHLTMLLAPRPALLTYNSKDNCCFESGYALPPLLAAATPIYKLLGQEANLTRHINDDPGDHNFGLDNRQALYRKLAAHFFADSTEPPPGDEIDCTGELKTKEELHVELPERNADFHSLAVDLAARLDHRLRSYKREWQDRDEQRRRLIELVRADPECSIVPQAAATADTGGTKANFWRLRIGDQWTVPAVEIFQGEPRAATIVLADGGRASVADQVMSLVDQGQRVVAVDPFYFGESKIKERDFLYALQVATVGERPLGIQSSQINAIARWLKRQRQVEQVAVTAVGKRASLIGLVAAAIDADSLDALALHRSWGSLKQVIEEDVAVNAAPELFCFGLLQEFDIASIAALVVPRKVSFVEPSARLREEITGLQQLYSNANVRFDPVEINRAPDSP